MKQTITYLLHRFPRATDTFIMREIRSLQRAGVKVNVISVWKPLAEETIPELLAEWSEDVSFLLPSSIPGIMHGLFSVFFSAPRNFFAAFRLALRTSRPGIRGHVYQIFYLIEAALATQVMVKNSNCHLHNHFGDQSGTVTMLAAVISGVRYSISYHGPHIFLDGMGPQIQEKVRRAAFNRCISFFCRSQLLLFAGSNDVSSARIIHCGLDLGKYSFKPPREEVMNVFCAARLAPEKGIEFLLQAINLLAKEYQHVRLRLAGDGPSKLPLQEMAKRLGISQRVDFLGQLSETQVTTELLSSDLFVLPSLAEGLPVSVMEAMAIGVPVIATNIAGVSELVENGENGLLVRPTDPEGLAEAITIMIEDYAFRLSAADRARRKVEAEFDIGVETSKLKELFLRGV
jgi:colanic acid/amylovoran biosynthesis glycosyltransferase